ncbi:Transcriptional repressor PaaX [Jannaschia seosinensis]|uniref:Transcriptional repressor PaaX n=1 Tax=Jannaschia seosinensis TaxID=313367 RepID=A0A0M7BCF1_9RHOB|nr:PaaX family transcriptional regulator C-terminal domain-containing protein [Jannaschia seosinensis]CUH39015.1 Transcriptional repressor PaaX [Jannaschia seosinensis]
MDDPIQLLTGGQVPRVWSVLVTIFGDLATAPGRRLSGAELRALVAPMGIRPEALRVALHRLRGDGWLEAERQGRETSHALTPRALAESRMAARRIYAAEASKSLFLVLAEPGTALHNDVTPVTAQIGLACRGGTERIPLDHVPNWIRAKICPPEQVAAMADLLQRMRAVDPACTPDPVALRIVLVHEWRRAILRLPDLPDRAFAAAWPGAAARGVFHELLTELPRPEGAAPERDPVEVQNGESGK